MILAQITDRADGPYNTVAVASGPVYDTTVIADHAERHGAELSEAVAVHEAVKWVLTRTEPATIHYDIKSAGRSAEGCAEPPTNIANLTRATQGLLSVARVRPRDIAFEHVKSHEGAPFNELADDFAKAGALVFCDTGAPFMLSADWYNPESPTADWAWLLHTTAQQREALGLPPVEGPHIKFSPHGIPQK